MSEGSRNHFSLSADDLADLFHPDNVRNGESLGKLGMWGGIPGIEKALSTNIKVFTILILEWID
jgi:hypothetical protein